MVLVIPVSNEINRFPVCMKQFNASIFCVLVKQQLAVMKKSFYEKWTTGEFPMLAIVSTAEKVQSAVWIYQQSLS